MTLTTPRASWPKNYSSQLPPTSRINKRERKLDDTNDESRRKIQLQQGICERRLQAAAHKMAILNSKRYEGPSPYVRHDWKQVKEFYEQPLFEKLKERGRMNQATLKSLGWPLSLKAFRIRQELAKAHHRILSLRRRARRGFVVTEDQERAAYGDYATYLCVLEDLTDYKFPFPKAVAFKWVRQICASGNVRVKEPSGCKKNKLD